MDPMTIAMGVKVGVGLLETLFSGQDQNKSQPAGGDDGSDAEPRMPQDSVHLSNPDDHRDDNGTQKNLGNMLMQLCAQVAECALTGS